MSDEAITIPCPWGDRKEYTGHWIPRTWEGYRFLSQPSSVVAVKDGVAITECVTVDGAIRDIKRRLRAEKEKAGEEPDWICKVCKKKLWEDIDDDEMTICEDCGKAVCLEHSMVACHQGYDESFCKSCAPKSAIPYDQFMNG